VTFFLNFNWNKLMFMCAFHLFAAWGLCPSGRSGGVTETAFNYHVNEEGVYAGVTPSLRCCVPPVRATCRKTKREQTLCSWMWASITSASVLPVWVEGEGSPGQEQPIRSKWLQEHMRVKSRTVEDSKIKDWAFSLTAVTIFAALSSSLSHS